MKPKHLTICLACILLLAAPAAAAGGDGTSANPYQIETAAELQSIQNDLSAHYIIMNDLDLTGVTWTPIGSSPAPFFGSLDGDGHTISNLNINSNSGGIFHTITSGAVIKDLILSDCIIVTSPSNQALLTGIVVMSESVQTPAIISGISIINCSVDSINGGCGMLTGAILSNSILNIVDCNIISSSLDISGNNAGFLCGIVSDTELTINNCNINSCKVNTGGYNSALCVGYPSVGSTCNITNCNIVNCIAESGSINSALCVGYSSGSCNINVESCTFKNSIAKSSGYNAGGIISTIEGTGGYITASDCNIFDCTIVSNNNYAGGVAGRIATGNTGVFTNNIVTGCTVLANAYAAGICPAYS